MATTQQSMTPDQALQTLATVRDYRERLTGRAAGIVWMVWGFALALLASIDMIALVDGDGSLAAGAAGSGAGTGFVWPGWITLLLPVAALVAAALTTNAVWRAHALERGATHRSWVAWVAIVGLLVAGAGIGFAVVQMLADGVSADDPASSYVLIMPLLAAVAAGIIAVLQRHRVSLLPGLAAAVLLIGLQFAIPLATSDELDAALMRGIQTSMLGIVAVFVATGLWYYKRG